MLNQIVAVSKKNLVTAIVVSTLVSACGSDSDSPTPPAPEIAGLWDATSINIDSQTVPVPAGEIYFLAENVEENPILATFYFNTDSNCLDEDPALLTHYGNSKYKSDDGGTGTATISANRDALSVTLDVDNEIMNIRFSKEIGLAKIDLPVCSQPQSSDDGVIQNDESSTGLETFIASAMRFFN